jgi:hypothetical protein
VEKRYIQYGGGMNLSSGNEPPFESANCAEKSSPVFEHVGALILTHIAEAECLVRQRTDTTLTRSESVPESLIFEIS